MKKQFVYYAKLLDYIDGDTMDIILDKGDDEFRGTEKNPVRVRLADCDTPEIRGELRPFGLFVKDYCENVMPTGQVYQLISEALDRDNFARFLVDFVGSNEQTLSRHLIMLGYAIPYFDVNGKPKSKEQRLKEHKYNMQRLIDGGLIL